MLDRDIMDSDYTGSMARTVVMERKQQTHLGKGHHLSRGSCDDQTYSLDVRHVGAIIYGSGISIFPLREHCDKS